MLHLSPCPACSRHVRINETACPFCGVELDLSRTPEPILPTRRLGRSATFAFSATLASAAVVTACGGESQGPSTDLGNPRFSGGSAGEFMRPLTGGTGTIYGLPGVGGSAGLGSGGTGGVPQVGGGAGVAPRGGQGGGTSGAATMGGGAGMGAGAGTGGAAAGAGGAGAGAGGAAAAGGTSGGEAGSGEAGAAGDAGP